MAVDTVTVTIAGTPPAGGSSDTVQITVGPAGTALPPAASGNSGFYQNLGDGRGYIPLDLYIGYTDPQALAGLVGPSAPRTFGIGGTLT